MTSPIHDDTAVLPAKPAIAVPKRWWTRITLALCALMIPVAGFAGGIEAMKHLGASATASAQTAGGLGGGFPGGAATAAPAADTKGTVQTVNGETIYVQTTDGKVVTVKTDSKTTVSTATSGQIADVKAGQSITVQGVTGADGTVTATSVTTQPK